jgi:hypothetical protein
MPEEEDFESKSHVTKHLTGSRFNIIRERTRINSWEEQDFLNWKEFLAFTLSMDRITPLTLKTITDTSKYKNAYKSYSFGIVKLLTSKWYLIPVILVAVVAVILVLTGTVKL